MVEMESKLVVRVMAEVESKCIVEGERGHKSEIWKLCTI